LVEIAWGGLTFELKKLNKTWED